MSTLSVDNITGQTASSKVGIPGHVVQVVQGSKNTVTNTTSTTFVDSGLTATISPHFATSKILVTSSFGSGSQTSSAGMVMRLVRGSTELYYAGNAYSSGGGSYGVTSVEYLDSPATTSATTYKIQFLTQASTVTCYFNPTYSGYGNPTAFITLMEIAQ